MNGLPGMTPASLLPKAAEAIGIEYGDLCEIIIDQSFKARYTHTPGRTLEGGKS